MYKRPPPIRSMPQEQAMLGLSALGDNPQQFFSVVELFLI